MRPSPVPFARARARVRRDLPLLGTVVRLSLPVVVANLLQSLVNVADVFMAGRLGPTEVAAVGMATAVRLLVLLAIVAVTSGSMALAAQAKGARDDEALATVAKQSLWLVALVAAALTLVGVATAEPLLRFLNSGGDPRAVALGAGYLEVLFLGTVLMVVNVAVASLMQGAGDTVTPLWLTGGTAVLNVLFNGVLVFGWLGLPSLGVTGLAIGTLLARGIGGAVGIAILASGRNVVRLRGGRGRPDLGSFRDILAIGVPSALQTLMFTSANVFVIRIITSTPAGTFGAAAQAIGIQIESLAFMPGLALSVAATSLVGRSLGAWQLDEARRRGAVTLVLGIAVMGGIAAAIFVAAPWLVRAFDPSAHPVVVEAGTSYLRINALAQAPLAVFFILNGGLRGAGDTRPGLTATALGRWIVMVPLAALLALGLDLGVDGVWWAMVASVCVQAAWVARRWSSGRWIDVSLQQSRLYRRHLASLAPEVREAFLGQIRAPLMADARTSERLLDDGVRYDAPEGPVRVVFDGAVRVVEGAERLPAGARQALAVDA